MLDIEVCFACLTFKGKFKRTQISNLIIPVLFFCVHSELRKPLLPVGRTGILISEILHILCKQMVSDNLSDLLCLDSFFVFTLLLFCLLKAFKSLLKC